MAKKPAVKKKTAPKAPPAKSKKKAPKKIKFTLTAQGEAELMDDDQGGGTPG